MDANAYLRRQGWKGAGHSLDHRGSGLKKPLLISHKQDQLGLGKKKAAHNVDDQWWMRAFDESLQNIGTGQESTLNQIRKQGINRGGLYGFFVKGEGMPGTITNTEESSTATTDSSALSSRADTPATSSNDPSDVSDSAVDVSADKIKKSSKAKKTASLKRKREDERENTGKKQRAGGKAKTLLNLGSIDKEAEVMAGIKREAARIVKEKEDAGEFGPKTPKSKHQREQSARAAKKEAKKTLVVDAMMEGKLPNPKNHTKEEALQNYEKDMKAQKKAAKQQEKAARRGEKRKLKQEVHETPSDVATARAKEEPNAEISRQQAALTKKIAGLTVQERAQYEKRAASKSQSFEQYVLRRIQKKVEKKSE